MAHHNTSAERQIIKFIEKCGLPEAEKKAWIDQVQLNGMTEEQAEAIQERISHPAENEAPLHNRPILLVDLNRLVRQWRMELGAKKFTR
jgi:hypothetical protein